MTSAGRNGTTRLVVPDWARRHDQHCPANQGGVCTHEAGCPMPLLAIEKCAKADCTNKRTPGYLLCDDCAAARGNV